MLRPSIELTPTPNLLLCSMGSRARGDAGRYRLIGRERAYHGVGFGGISVGGIVTNRRTYGPMLPGTPRFDTGHRRVVGTVNGGGALNGLARFSLPRSAAFIRAAHMLGSMGGDHAFLYTRYRILISDGWDADAAALYGVQTFYMVLQAWITSPPRMTASTRPSPRGSPIGAHTSQTYAPFPF